MSEIHIGDVLKITINGATVTDTDDGMDTVTVSISTELGSFETSVPTDSDAVTVERVSDEPEPGDVYQDDDGDTWLVRHDGLLASEIADLEPRTFERASRTFGPLVRVYRKAEEAA